MMKKNLKILKTWLVIVISIIAITFIIHWLFYGNRRYIFPVEIGKLELNYEVRPDVYIDFSSGGALQLLDQLEQEQGYVDIEELGQLRDKIEGIDGGYIIFSYRRPLQYIIHYEGRSLLGEYSMDQFGSNGHYGEDNGNVLYLYRVRQKIGWPYDGNI